MTRPGEKPISICPDVPEGLRYTIGPVDIEHVRCGGAVSQAEPSPANGTLPVPARSKRTLILADAMPDRETLPVQRVPLLTRNFGLGLALGAITALLIGIVAWMTMVYTGAYNVAASDPHSDAARWTLETSMRKSVANRATHAGIPNEPSSTILTEGAGHYAESCVLCHGAPGQEPAEWSRAMRPEPPHLIEAASEWSPDEIHWIISNGIKMTGMPAFSDGHTPEQLTALTAFVSALPGLTPGDYESLTGDADKHHVHSDGAEAEHHEETRP